MTLVELPAGALWIGPAEEAALAALREKASRAPHNILEVIEALKTDAGRQRHKKRMQALSCLIPTCYWAAFCIETHHPRGTVRHMSLSSLRPGKVPLPESVWQVASQLGFVGGLEACAVFLEDLSDGGKAVNVLQALSFQPAPRPQ